MGGNGKRTGATKDVSGMIHGDHRMLIPKGAKPKEASEAEKPNEAAEADKPKKASSQKQNLISNETNFAMLLTQVVEKLIQRPSKTLELEAAKQKKARKLRNQNRALRGFVAKTKLTCRINDAAHLNFHLDLLAQCWVILQKHMHCVSSDPGATMES